MNLAIRFFFIIYLFLFTRSDIYAETTYFTGFSITNRYHQYVGKVSFESGILESNQDELGVFVADTNNEGLLIGACRIGDTYPGYYLVNIFGDDSHSPIKDGAKVNDILTFKIWDKSENKLYVLSNTNSLSRETESGLTYPELPPKFESGFGGQYGFLNLTARNQDLNESIVRFEGIPQKGSIKLTWSTDCETNLSGFFIFRKSTKYRNYINISANIIPTKGNEFLGAAYCFIDNDVFSNIFYNYQLIGIDLNGQQTIIQTLTDLSVSQSCSSHMDLNGDNQFGLADIIELMKRIMQ
jgi:hypothetical protein